MLKRSKEIARTLAESAGIVAPNLPTVQEAAEQRRVALVEALDAVSRAETELDRQHDIGAPVAEVQAAEARLADSRLSAERAQKAYSAAERRLATAREAEAEKAKAAAIVARDAALDRRAKIAQRIDELAAELATLVDGYDAQLDPLSEAARLGVAARAANFDGAQLARHALERAGALPSRWLGPRHEQPGAVRLAEQQRGAVLAVAS